MMCWLHLIQHIKHIDFYYMLTNCKKSEQKLNIGSVPMATPVALEIRLTIFDADSTTDYMATIILHFYS